MGTPSARGFGPLVVAAHPGQLVLVDGFARQAAALHLGLPSVTVEAVKLTAVQAKEHPHLRRGERGLALPEECRRVCEMGEADGLSQVQVADMRERHKRWGCRLIARGNGLSAQLVAGGALEQLEAGSL